MLHNSGYFARELTKPALAQYNSGGSEAIGMSKNRWLIPALAVLLAAALAGCSMLDRIVQPKEEPSSSSEKSEEIEEAPEDPNYPVEAAGARLSKKPEAVVSLSPAVTEKIFDLEQGGQLAGVSDYCDYPGEANDRKRCGTAKAPDRAAIAGLGATLVITESPLSDSDAQALRDAGCEVAVLPHAGSIEGVLDNYRAIARLLEGDLDGTETFAVFEQNFRDRLLMLEADAAAQVSAVYLLMLDYTVATGDTLENELMALIGCDNIAKDQRDWAFDRTAAQGSDRALFLELDVIFMDENHVNIKMLEKSDIYKGLNAVLKDYYVYIDSTAFERQSRRMLDELEKMADSEFVKGA